MERVNGCRELGHCSVVCLGFDELIGFESPMVCCDEFRWFDPMRCVFSCGTLCFTFYRPRENRGYNGGKKENQKEKKSSRITGSFFSSMWVPPSL